MLFISLLAMVCYGILVLQNVAGEETGKLCKNDYIPCSNDVCCCNNNLAYCSGYGSLLSYIPELPDGIGRLDFGNNYLPVLSMQAFANISTMQITHLYIKADHVVNITEDAFKDIEYMTTLELISNRNINKTQLSLSFGSLPNVQVLNLQNIGLSHSIPINFFKRLQNASVTDLLLDNNELQTVNMTVFKYLPRLRHLRLANNRITNLYANTGHPRLNTLILTQNEILRYPPYLCQTNHSMFPVLKNLYLNDNYINILYREAWKCLYSLKLLVIGGNYIRQIKENVIVDLPSLTELRVNRMHGMQGTSIRIQKAAFNSTSLRHLDISSNNIIFTKDHLKHNFFENCRGLTFLDVSRNNLVHLDDDEITRLFSPLTHIQNLYMVSTHIRSIPENLLATFTDLVSLNVDGNNIQNISHALNGLTKLRNLSAKENNISELTPQSFPEQIIKTLRMVNLADNYLECSCKNYLFRTWIGDEGRPEDTNISLSGWPLRFICRTPSDWSGKQFKTYQPTFFSCNLYLYIYLVFVVIVGAAIVSIVFVWHYIWHIKYMLYRLVKWSNPKRRASLGETDYPVEPYTYVIYHDDDTRFVHNVLRDRIETKLGLKLYIWHRDAPLGSKANAMFDAIHSSSHILAILSNNFITDGWCEFQLNISLLKKNDKREDCLTLLVLEGLDCSLLQRSWCVTFVRNATVYWSSDQNSIKAKLCSDQLTNRLAGKGKED